VVEPVATIDYAPAPPAPGQLHLVERFCNTLDEEHGREVLHDPQSLYDLLFELALVDPGTRVTRRDLERAHDLRDRLRSLALANNGVPTDVSLEATLTVHVSDDTAVLDAGKGDVDGALAQLVGIVYTAMHDGSWSRLKACKRDVCHWLFYDRSRNRSAVWCSMAVCGNRTKTRNYRARRS
jgi:CGNR zinc finger/Putative stress-induced transcription regulator